MGKTSLQKSHSKISNFKLTLICLFSSIAFSMIWFGFILISRGYDLYGMLTTGIAILACLLGFVMIGKFSR